MSREKSVKIIFGALEAIATNEQDFVKIGDITVDATDKTKRSTLQEMEEQGWVYRNTEGGKHYHADHRIYLLANVLADPEKSDIPPATDY